MGNLKLLWAARKGGRVMRMHNQECIRRETVAEHSYGVAWLCFVLTDGKPSANLLMAALAHDIPEGEYGDIPSPAKRIPAIGRAYAVLEEKFFVEVGCAFALTPIEEHTLKVADILDGLMFCTKEIQLGNKTVFDMFNKYCEYFETTEQKNETGIATKIFQEILGRKF